jgi:RNA polymerase sigma factor (sigma-70 family)
MATNVSKVLRHLHHLLEPPGGERTDGELLGRFVATRDEASFAALVRRHGPMVLSVCRRMLQHVQDAEECFQVTFIVLARKAAKVKRESVGSWLYAVAYRTSLEARAVNARRRARERQVQDMPHPEVLPPEAQDWRPWFDQELNRLPEKFRAAIVTCDLEGRSRKEAAQLLGLSEGTLSSRLARGRRLLANRLAPYELSLPPIALAAALGTSAARAQVPAALLSSTTKAALLVAAGEYTALSASSSILMKGVLKSMFAAKLKLTISATMIVMALGASGLVYRASGQPSASAEKRTDGKPQSELERLRHENELLKLNLEVVLEKVRAQEAELRALKGPAKSVSLDVGIPMNMIIGSDDGIKNETQGKVEKIQKNSNKEVSAVRDYSITGLTREEADKLNNYLKQLKATQSSRAIWEERAAWSERMARPGRQYVPKSQAEADQARLRDALLDEADAALKVLREARDAETRQKATDVLDKALKKLGSSTKQPQSSNR